MRSPALPLLAALAVAFPATVLAGGRGGHPAPVHHSAPRPQVHHAAPAPRMAVQHHSAPKPQVHHAAPKPQVHHNPAPKTAAPKPQAQHHPAPKPQAHPKPATVAGAKTTAKPKDQPHAKPTSKPQHSTASTKLAKAATNSAAPNVSSPVPNPGPDIFGPVPKATQSTFGPVPTLSQNINGPVPSLKTASGRSVVVQQAAPSSVSTSVTSVNPTTIGTGLVGVGSPGLGYGYNPWSSGNRRRSYGRGYGYGGYRRGYYSPRRYYVVRRNTYGTNNGTNVVQDPALQRLRAALESIPVGGTAAPATTARLTNDLLGVVQGPIQPPMAPVEALAGRLAEGVARRTSPGFNGLPLAQALKVAMNGAFLPRAEVNQAITLGQSSLRTYGVPSAAIGQITRQLRIIALDAAPNRGPIPAPAAVAAAPPAS